MLGLFGDFLKKLTIAIFAYLSWISFAFADQEVTTHGNYLEADFINTKSNQEARVPSGIFANGDNLILNNEINNSGNGQGLSYKYAFSM